MFNNAGLTCVDANNEVLPGINKVSTALEVKKDGRPGLFVDPKCVNIIMEFENYSYAKPEVGKVQADKPLKVYDDSCFVADTKVFTNKGEIPIARIKVGDMVLTRKGFKRVLNAGLTKRNADIFEVEFSNGVVLRATGNHPIWVKNKGFIRLDALRNGYKVLGIQNNKWHKKLSSTEWFFGKIENQVISNLMEHFLIKELVRSIGKFGSFTKEKFLWAIKSITKIITKVITKFQTWNVSPQKNMPKDIQENMIQNTLKESESLLKFGIDQKKVECGTLSMVRKLGRNGSLLKSFVLYAELRLWILVGVILLDSATRTVKLKNLGEDIKVINVEKLFKKEDVFDLTVEDCHEFYANDILCHNCDAIRYAVSSLGIGEMVLLKDGDGVFF